MEKIKVSVIIPVYNSERYLRECLNSVVNQTLKEIEIICVDDGSTDGSIDILKEFADQDSRIQIICQQNQFAGAARNNGMKEAKGKYLAFWDADDYFELNALELLYKKSEKENADLCLCAAYIFNDGETQKVVDETILKKRFLPKDKVFSIETYPEYIFNITARAPWNKIVKASFLRENNIEFQNLKNANDTYFSMICMYYAKRITYVTAPLINYRVNNSESITGKASSDPICGYLSYAAVYDEIKEKGICDKAMQSFYSRLYNGLIRSIMIHGENNSMQAAYDKVKNEGFEYFDIHNHLNREYCYFKSDYEDMVFISEHTLTEFLMFKFRKENSDKIFYK
ncbi:MAG: glycosyltransferase, partial [Eubacterium sp.]|nr:glycosyltransferase [Eubacterium sp.]